MPRISFVFPGQGSQKVGMGGDLAQNFPAARRVFEEASDTAGRDLLRLCTEGPAEDLNRTELTQPAILTMSMAALRVLESECDVRPDFVAGHSLGEYTAAAAGGAMDLAAAVALVNRRGRYMQEAVPEGRGAMAAILGLELEEVQEICNEVDGLVVPANLNCPGQIVISGEKGAVEDAAEQAREMGAKRALVLDVSVPSHSPLMEPAAHRLSEVLQEAALSDLSVPLVNNAAAEIVRTAGEVRQGLVKQLTSPVRWEEGVRKLAGEGVAVFIEIGPGRVLSSLIRRIQRNAQVLNLEDSEGLEPIRRAGRGEEV